MSAVKKMIIRNVEPADSILKANRIVRGIAPQVGAGEGSTIPAIQDCDHCFRISVLRA